MSFRTLIFSSLIFTGLISNGFPQTIDINKGITGEINRDEKFFLIHEEYVSPFTTLINANGITSWISFKSSTLEWPPLVNGKFNGTFPRGKPVGVIFRDGLVIAGLVYDGNSPVVRAQGVYYTSSFVPGRITLKGQAENPDAPDVKRIWRVRIDYRTADLRVDAAEYFNKPINEITQSDIDAIRSRYEEDWESWPADKGAPWYKIKGKDAFLLK